MKERDPRVVKDIDPKRWYTVNELYKEVSCFPWLVNYRGYLETVKQELHGKNLLNVREIKSVKKNRYLVQGCDILKYLKKVL